MNRQSAGVPPLNTAVDGLFWPSTTELRHIAHRHLQHEPTGHTVTTTDLVHQPYLTLSEQTRAQWASRAHFMSVAATAMRRILIDHARSRLSVKRGGEMKRIPLEAAAPAVMQPPDVLVALDEAVDRLGTLDARQAQVVECRFFGGMTEDEIAEALGIGVRTTRRDWVKAMSWLYRELYAGAGDYT